MKYEKVKNPQISYQNSASKQMQTPKNQSNFEQCLETLEIEQYTKDEIDAKKYEILKPVP